MDHAFWERESWEVAGFSADVGANVEQWVVRGLSMEGEQREAHFRGSKLLTKEQLKRSRQSKTVAEDDVEMDEEQEDEDKEEEAAVGKGKKKGKGRAKGGAAKKVGKGKAKGKGKQKATEAEEEGE